MHIWKEINVLILKKNHPLAKVLISGGSGLIGSKLSRLLLDSGHEVAHLSRSASSDSEIPTYVWNIKEGSIDIKALEGVDSIVHLAGASVADGRWTSSRKKMITDSRIKSTEMLAKAVMDNDIPLKNFICANAIGIYGDRGDEWLYEASAPEDDWMARLCKDWEMATDVFTEWGVRTATIRLGLVLSEAGGALPKLLGPAKMGVNPILGSGKQWYPWIHIEDAVSAIIHIIDDSSLTGPYNIVAPSPVTQKGMAEAIDKVLDKKTFKPFTPGFMMKLAMGEMARIVLSSARVSSEKLLSTGFRFKYTELDAALKDLVWV